MSWGAPSSQRAADAEGPGRVVVKYTWMSAAPARGSQAKAFSVAAQGWGAMMDRVDTPSVGSILPPGFLDGVGALHQPEKRLIAAVLEGAVGDFQKYATAFNGRGKRLFTDAEEWFESTTADRPLDFENICQALGLDPSFIREGLRRWCIARRRESPSRTVLHFPSARVSATRHTISAMP